MEEPVSSSCALKRSGRDVPGVIKEVFVPDLRGDAGALDTLLQAAPEVFNHNVETVPSFYPNVRLEAYYGRLLKLLHRVAQNGVCRVKTWVMLG